MQLNDVLCNSGTYTGGYSVCERPLWVLENGHCEGQNGLHTHFARQCNICYVDGDGVTWCKWDFTLGSTVEPNDVTIFKDY